MLLEDKILYGLTGFLSGSLSAVIFGFIYLFSKGIFKEIRIVKEIEEEK